jgi:hypothetical protein
LKCIDPLPLGQNGIRNRKNNTTKYRSRDKRTFVSMDEVFPPFSFLAVGMTAIVAYNKA